MNPNTESLGARARRIVEDAQALKKANPLLAVGPIKQAVDLVESVGVHMIEMSDRIDALTPYLDELEGQGGQPAPDFRFKPAGEAQQ